MGTHTLNEGRGLGPLPRLRLTVLTCLLVLPLAGCDRLLEVRDPEFATPESLEDPAALPLLVLGAVGDFQRAYGGGAGGEFGFHSEGVVTTTAAITDEFISSGTFTTRTATDRRMQFAAAEGNTTDVTFFMLQRARRSAKAAAEAVARVVGAEDTRIALLRSLEGYTYVALAENFCSNIPVSEVVDGQFVGGPPLSTQQMFQEAIVRFDQALGVASPATPLAYLASVGKARALLNLGLFTDAGMQVAAVPDNFIHFIEHSDNTSRQENQVFGLQGNGRWSQSHLEGGNGLPFRGGDPRTPFVFAGGGFDASIDLFISLRYPNRGSNVVLADGIEARLIEAEAELQADPEGLVWLDILNALRANVATLMAARYDDYAANVPGATLDPLTDPGTAAGRVDLMFAERGFWLFLTGHRLGDLRRLLRAPYGRSESDVFPSGEYHKGDDYGTDVSFVIPFDEENNPEYSVSLCDVTAP